MMKAVARLAKEKGIDCEASLENLMACGLGACLCCVEKVKTSPDLPKGEEGLAGRNGSASSTDFSTRRHSPPSEGSGEVNVCVCKDGPVFDTKRLLWIMDN